ncbi:MAG: lipocalin-like domain-containing protein [Pseudomonadota bacterium]
MNDLNSLVGTWALIAWYNRTTDGQQFYPLGEDATGYIGYTEDGFVFVQMAARDRALYVANDPFGGSLAEDSAAMKTQIAYSGVYRRHGDLVVHHVTHASCPNWVGSEQTRHIEFVGNRLRLSAPGAVFQGREVTAHVEWQRATV